MKNTVLIMNICALLFSVLSCAKQEITEKDLSSYIEAKNTYIEGNMDEALNMFLKISENNPDFTNSSFMAAKMYFLKEDYENAEKLFLNIIKDNPFHIDTRKYLARTYFNQFRLEDAEEQVVMAMEVSSEDPDLLIILADIKKRREDYASAIELYKKAAVYETRFAVARIELAEIYRGVGLFDKTEEELEKALCLIEEESPYYNPVNNILEGLRNEN